MSRRRSSAAAASACRRWRPAPRSRWRAAPDREASELAARTLQKLAARGRADPLQRDAFTVAARAALAVSDRGRPEPTPAMRSPGHGPKRSTPRPPRRSARRLLLEAQVRLQQGDRPGAAALAREALPHLQQNLGPAHPSTRQAEALGRV